MKTHDMKMVQMILRITSTKEELNNTLLNHPYSIIIQENEYIKKHPNAVLIIQVSTPGKKVYILENVLHRKLQIPLPPLEKLTIFIEEPVPAEKIKNLIQDTHFHGTIILFTIKINGEQNIQIIESAKNEKDKFTSMLST